MLHALSISILQAACLHCSEHGRVLDQQANLAMRLHISTCHSKAWTLHDVLSAMHDAMVNTAGDEQTMEGVLTSGVATAAASVWPAASKAASGLCITPPACVLGTFAELKGPLVGGG